MKLENQVTNLEISRKLKELGVKQNGFWCWAKDGHLFSKNHIGLRPSHGEADETRIATAFTVAELGEILKKDIHKSFDSLDSGWACSYITIDTEISDEDNQYDKELFQYADTEADARGKCLTYLIENGIISVDDINKGG